MEIGGHRCVVLAKVGKKQGERTMQVQETALAGVKVIAPKRFSDARGFFSETYNQRALAEIGIDAVFVQDNHSLSRDKGVVRGLHFQSPPHAQGKLLRVIRGAILDVAVDIRRGSPSYGRHVSVELSAEDWNQIWVPEGFAHGFCTLTNDTEVLYKVTAFYEPAHDHGIAWDDPDLGIDWPIDAGQAILSDKDRQHPRLADLPDYFGL